MVEKPMYFYIVSKPLAWFENCSVEYHISFRQPPSVFVDLISTAGAPPKETGIQTRQSFGQDLRDDFSSSTSDTSPYIHQTIQTVLRKTPALCNAGIACWLVHSLHLKVGLRCSPGAYRSPSSFVQIISWVPVMGFGSQKLIPCCFVGLGKAFKMVLILPESRSALKIHPICVILCKSAVSPGVKSGISSYLIPLAAITSPVTWNIVPLLSFMFTSTQTPTWYRFSGSSGSRATESSSGTKTRYQPCRGFECKGDKSPSWVMFFDFECDVRR